MLLSINETAFIICTALVAEEFATFDRSYMIFDQVFHDFLYAFDRKLFFIHLILFRVDYSSVSYNEVEHY